MTVTSKKCINCGETKEVSFFYSDKRCVDGYTNQCKGCASNKVKMRAKAKKLGLEPVYYEGIKRCSECGTFKPVAGFFKSSSAVGGFRSQCKECSTKRSLAHAKANRKHVNAVKRKLYSRNRTGYYVLNEGVRVCTKCDEEQGISAFGKTPTGRDGRQSWCRSCNYEYKKEKGATDIQYRLGLDLRRRLGRAISGAYRSGSAVRDLDCTIPELINYLKAQFYPRAGTGEEMTWEEHGRTGWHIDHIKRLADFDLTDRKQFLEAVHYTNLRPLWAEDNLSRSKHAPVEEATL